MSLRDYLFHEEPGIELYCGDCRDVLPLLNESDRQSLVSDPPYPNRVGHFAAGLASALQVLMSPWSEAVVFWDRLTVPQMRLPLVAKHVWHRTNVNGAPWEAVYEFRVDGQSRRCDVLEHPAIFDGAGPGCHEYAGHPTQKPVSIMRTLVGKLRGSGPVIDPFFGSGSTIIAAKDLGRRAIGIEIEPRYCEIAVKRLRQEVLAL